MCTLDIMDTAGEEETTQLRDQYIKNGDGFICAYSSTSRWSLQAIITIIEDIHKIKQKNKEDKVPLVLVATQYDLVNEIKEKFQVKKEEIWQILFIVLISKALQKRGSILSNLFINLFEKLSKNWDVANNPPKKYCLIH